VKVPEIGYPKNNLKGEELFIQFDAIRDRILQSHGLTAFVWSIAAGSAMVAAAIYPPLPYSDCGRDRPVTHYLAALTITSEVPGISEPLSLGKLPRNDFLQDDSH
jgi:hypothetical protein